MYVLAGGVGVSGSGRLPRCPRAQGTILLAGCWSSVFGVQCSGVGEVRGKVRELRVKHDHRGGGFSPAGTTCVSHLEIMLVSD